MSTYEETWKIDDINGEWIVFRETRSGVEAFACNWKGMAAVAPTPRSLVQYTPAKTYRSKSAAVAAVRRRASVYERVSVRGDTVHIR